MTNHLRYAPRAIRLPRLRGPGGARRSRTDDILLAKQALYQLSYGPVPENGAKPRRAVGDAVLRLRTPSEPEVLVGPGRLELPTLRLSGVRSNHLSYGPMAVRQAGRSPGSRSRHQQSEPNVRSVDDEMTKEKRRRRRPAVYWSLNRQSRERRPGEASLERR